MVVEETDEGEEWLPDHELNPLLARPNPDYGMARLIEATETYLCLTGRCLWVKNRDRQGRVAMLYPFSGDEFTSSRRQGACSVASSSAGARSRRKTRSTTRTSRRPIRSAAPRRSTRRSRT
jgi:phage portal protein BeeE